MEHTWIKVDDWSTLPKNLIGLYRLTSPSGKMYIGKSEKCIRGRWIRYACRRSCKSQKKLYDSLKKYQNFDKWTHEYFLYPLEECSKMEIYLIDYYDTFHNGLNSTGGGEGFLGKPSSFKGKKHSAKTKAIIGELSLIEYTLVNMISGEKCVVLGAKGLKEIFNIPWKEISVSKSKIIDTKYYSKSDWKLFENGVIIESNWKGAGVRNTGRKASQSTREKNRIIGRKNKNKKHTEQSRLNMRNGQLGKKQSPETVAKREATKKANRERKILEKQNEIS